MHCTPLCHVLEGYTSWSATAIAIADGYVHRDNEHHDNGDDYTCISWPEDQLVPYVIDTDADGTLLFVQPQVATPNPDFIQAQTFYEGLMTNTIL